MAKGDKRDNRARHGRVLGLQKGFLAAYSECGNVQVSLAHVGVSRQAHGDWLKGHNAEQYAKWFADAVAAFGDRMESECSRRGQEGVLELVISNGKPVFVWVAPNGEVVPDETTPGAVRKAHYKRVFSDTCLLAWLNANLPHKYRYNRNNQNESDQEPEMSEEEVLKRCKEIAPDAKPPELPNTEGNQ